MTGKLFAAASDKLGNTKELLWILESFKSGLMAGEYE